MYASIRCGILRALPIVLLVCIGVGMARAAQSEGAGAAERPATESAPSRSAYGGSFEGTFAYDSQVGYDYGQYDDNGRSPAYYENNRGREPRMPGKRPDPGDQDFFDPYYQGTLYNDGTLGDYDDLGGYLEFHGRIGRDRYWRSRRHIPLRYDDFREYQGFRYELGGMP